MNMKPIILLLLLTLHASAQISFTGSAALSGTISAGVAGAGDIP